MFVHYSQIQMGGYRKLSKGQRVQFELSEGPRGLFAVEVVRLDGVERPMGRDGCAAWSRPCRVETIPMKKEG